VEKWKKFWLKEVEEENKRIGKISEKHPTLSGFINKFISDSHWQFLS
jgi:hypothetical protein